MDQVLTGTVHGNTIVLDSAPALPALDGQQVEIVVRTTLSKPKWGDGIRNSAGGWADYPELDAVMARIHTERSIERLPPVGP